MEIHHHPKPWLGLREFSKEIGTIVIGVLLALGAEQGVEAMHWSHVTHEAEHQIRGELTKVSDYAFERIVFGPCVEQRLAGIGERLAAAKGEWRGDAQPHRAPELNALKLPFVGIVRPWADTIWQTAVASNSVSHMDSETANSFAAAYRLVGQLRANNESEQAATSSLMTLGTNRKLTPAATDRVEASLNELRYRNAFAQLTSRQLYDALRALKIASSADYKRLKVSGVRQQYGACAVDPDSLPKGA